MNFRHEDLDVWKLSMKLVTSTYKVTEKFPTAERYGLTSQLRRAAVSVSLNISEGSGRATKKDFANFVRNSIGSLLETDTALKISMNLNYLTKKEYDKVFDELVRELYFKLIKLNKSLKYEQ